MNKDQIFQAFLSRPAVLSTSELRGDLQVTNIGINGDLLSRQNQQNVGFGLVETDADGCRVVFEPHECGNSDFFENDYPIILEKGERRGWSMTGFDVCRNTDTSCFIHLYWIRTNPRIFDQEVNREWDSAWFQENCVSLMGIPNYFRFIIQNSLQDLAYVVEQREDKCETACYVEITEIIKGKKVRLFRRWFTLQNEEEVWEIVNYCVPAD